MTKLDEVAAARNIVECIDSWRKILEIHLSMVDGDEIWDGSACDSLQSQLVKLEVTLSEIRIWLVNAKETYDKS